MKCLLQAKLAMVFFFILGTASLFAQGDSIVFYNGNYMTGTVESMDKGIFVFSTEYSDDDFTIEWEKIKELYTTTIFVVTLSDGSDHLTTVRTLTPGQLEILGQMGITRVVSVDDVVELKPLSSKFRDRLSASWDVGYSYTRSTENTQFNARTFLGYEAEKWNTDLSFNANYSDQEGVERTQILNATWNFRYNLPARLFLIATMDMLQDSEQQLNLRANSQGGAGAYIIRTNKAYWTAKMGLNWNLERYVVSTNDRKSWEGFMGTEVNLYDLGDLDFMTSIVLYPGFTESGRWRSDMSFDVKYDFPLDFYVSSGFTLNWDNRPVEGADATNIIFLAGFGWEW